MAHGPTHMRSQSQIACPFSDSKLLPLRYAAKVKGAVSSVLAMEDAGGVCGHGPEATKRMIEAPACEELLTS